MRFLATLSLILFSSQISIASGFDIRSISDVSSIVARPDGRYDVTCKDGSKEVASMEQIRLGVVCGGGAVQHPEIEAIFAKSGGEFYVLCKSGNWETKTAADIEQGNVCSGGATNPDLPSGNFVDQRPIKLVVTIVGPNISLAWPHPKDLANGLYTCTGKPAVCVHESGYRVVVTGRQMFTWEYKEGSNDYQFRLDTESVKPLAGQ